MIDYDDDMAEILSEDDFGLVFSYNGDEYRGILSENYFEDDTDIGGFRPMLTTTVIVPTGTVLSLNGSDYEVIQSQPNRRNMVVLVLHAL